MRGKLDMSKGGNGRRGERGDERITQRDRTGNTKDRSDGS